MEENGIDVDFPKVKTAIKIKDTVGIKKPKSKKQSKIEVKRGRGRKQRDYPLGVFEDSLEFSTQLYDFGSGEKVRRLTIFDKIGKSPESSQSRALITNSNKYGLIKGNPASEFIELSTEGLNANKEEVSPYDKQLIKLKLAIENIPIFSFLYNKYKGNKLPNQTAISDIIKDEFKDIFPEDINEVVDLFILNAKHLQLLKVISGSERLVTFEHCLDDFSRNSNSTSIIGIGDNLDTFTADTVDTKILDQICFYITAIGEDGSDERKHSDLFLGSIVEPALESLNLKVVRADQIDKPGTITKQIIEFLSKAKLVIADLSFNNPNVFYELAIRHAFRLPTVQIVRRGDKIPFDVSNSRTIIIDTTDIYSLIPKLDTYRAEIANQVRQALQDPDSVDNPLTLVYPNIKLKI